MGDKADKRKLLRAAKAEKKEANNQKLIAATPTQGPRISAPEDGENAFLNWSFQFIEPGYEADRLDHKQSQELLIGMATRSSMTWAEINNAGRYECGYEPIKVKSLKIGKIPAALSDDKVLAFRESGLFRIMGFRNGQTFYVLYLDPKGELYDHD